MRVSSYRFLILTSLSTFALTACGSSDTIPKAKSDAPMPPIAEMDAAMMPSTVPSVGAPAGLMVNDTLTPIPANPSLSSATPPASSGILTPEQRLERLEASVMSLQNEYKRMAPAFASLNTTNQRIQSLLNELEATSKALPSAHNPQPLTAAPMTAPSVVMSSKVDEAPKTAVSSVPESKPVAVTPHVAIDQTLLPQASVHPSQSMPVSSPAAKDSVIKTDWAVKGVRVGEHGNKTRLVLDLTGNKKPPFTYDLDNSEKLLMIELPASWTGKEMGAPKSSMISSWKVQPSPQGGSLLAVQLAKSARIQSTQFLGAEGSDPARLVLDIAPTN